MPGHITTTLGAKPVSVWNGVIVEGRGGNSPDTSLVFTMTDQPGKPDRLAITVELSPTASGTHMHMTQEAPNFTEEQRKATIAGWQTFLDILQQITEAA